MKKSSRRILAVILAVGMLASLFTLPMTVSANGEPLKFGSDGKFKIVIFSDVQDQFPVHQRVINVMKQAIARENPDLIVYLGDITEQNIKEPEVDYRRTVEQIFSPAVEAGVPYAIVFGNHDDQSYYSGQRTDKAAMLSVIQSLGDCRTVDADPSLYGTGTCKIPVYSSDGSSIAFDLFMVDSNTYQNPTDGGSGYDNPHADQLEWLAANKDAGVNSFVFQHIPMPETFNLFKEDENGSKSYGGKKYALALNENATGSAGEFPHPCPADCNFGEFTTLRDMGGVLGVFTGHDHLNDFTGVYDGLRMTAVPGMTYYNYGKEEVRGYGVIELDENDIENYDYHSVKFSTLDAEAGETAETTYADYDLVTYADLRKDGNPLPETDYNIHGSNTFTYAGTSPTHSAIFKFRWTAGADNEGFQFSFDEGENGNIAYPFGVWIKKPNQGSAGSYGAWHLRPNQADRLVNMNTAVKKGDVYNIELGKLKILTGEPQHVGEYYLYLKVNGVLIQEAYSNAGADGQFMSGNALCQMENKIRFGDWSSSDNNNRISAYDFESFAPYDVIEYEDLLDTGDNHLAAEGTTLTAQNNLFHYEATSPSHSAIYKLRWTAGDDIYFQLHPGIYGSSNNFAYRINGENFNQRNPSADVPVGYTISEGDSVNIEIGRLLVADGDNAGKYYTYFKAGGKVIFEKYVSADDTNTASYLGDSIQLNLRDAAHYCEISPYIEEIPEEPADALYYKYDEIEYGDLRENGNYLASETVMSGGKTFTYNKTSSTGSAILKYRWTAVEGSKFQLSFDKAGSGVNYMFGVQLYAPGSEGHENSSIRLRPGLDDNNAWADLAENIEDGRSYDIEFARLKVKNGENAGKYYVYFKMDGELVSESYVGADVVDGKGNYKSNPGNADCKLSNEIYLTFWGASGNKISATAVPETYEPYDEVTYYDLLLNGSPLSAAKTPLNGNPKFAYNATSPTHSVVLKYRWTAGTCAEGKPHYVFYFDNWSGGAYPFCLAVKSPGYSGLGAAAGENGAWHIDPSKSDHIVQMTEPIVVGQDYDIEHGRIKVATGPNKNKYYVYLKVNGELIFGYYYDGVHEDGTYGGSNQAFDSKYLRFTDGTADNYISATPVVETYEDYDEIYYSDLKKNGQPLSAGGTNMSGGTVLTYDRKSPTGSAILRYRWTVGDVSKFQLSFEKTSNSAMAYMFGAWLSEPGAESGFPNGRMWLRPGYGPQAGFAEAIQPGSTHDVEFARLKVSGGSRKGKYYVYIKIDGELIAEDYVAAGDVDANLGYISNPNSTVCSMTSNEIFLAFWGSNGNMISAIPVEETYEDYDVIEYADLSKDGIPVPADGRTMSGGTVFTYNRTSPTGSAIFKYRWKVGSVAKFQMSFEKTADNTMAYMFGAWLSEPGAETGYDNGRMWLRPAYGPQAGFASALAAGASYNVEFARLKVKNGPNKGKYYVYIKIDDELIAEDYVAADVVDENLNYYSKPGEVGCSMTSNEIFFAFWGSEGNAIGAYKESAVGGHAGTRGDFDENGTINALDFTALINRLFGVIGDIELPEGIADFNNNGTEDIDDLIAVKKYIAPVNTYEKTGDLTVGTQEHLLEDATKTAEYIADASGTLGVTAYRLSVPIHQLYYATETNGVKVKADNMNALKELVAALKSKGITEILYVTDSFILPYGYSDPQKTHNKTVPDPATDKDNYLAWLNVNANAFAALAAEVPEIKFFEPFNEINVTGSRLETYGIGWNATAEQQAAHRFTVSEKAGIMADLCWYVSKAVKSVDAKNQVTTPSISLSGSQVVEKDFLDALYKAVESGNYPTGQALADKRTDSYFTIINIHLYPEYTDKSSQIETNANNFAASINAAYDVIKAHKDGGSRVWLTETGVSSYHGDGAPRNEETAAAIFNTTLGKIDNDLTYIDTVITYKLADISSDNGASPVEAGYGLFYSGDDLDYDPYTAKPIAKTVYSFTHGGSADYSELDALASRYGG